jgi:hypothetical protein
MDLSSHGYCSVKATRLAELCIVALDGINIALDEKVAKNKSQIEYDWDNPNFWERMTRKVFHVERPKIDRNWIIQNTADPDGKGVFGRVFLWAYKCDERRALKQMLSLCETSKDGDVWISAEFATLLQKEIALAKKLAKEIQKDAEPV